MKKVLHSLNLTIVLAMLCFSASAVTVFDDGDPANSYIENANNWDNGAPSAANPGTISTNAKVGLHAMTNWVVTQTAGDITQGSFPNLSLNLKGGSWTMNGGSMSQRAHTYSDGAVFTMNNGSIETKNNSYITVNGSGSQLIVNGGTIDDADRGIKVVSGGEFTLNGGAIISDTADGFGAYGFAGSGTMNFNGGTLTAGRFTFQGTTLATFGGSTAGSATFVNWGNEDNADRHNDDVVSIDFLPGSLMALTITAPRALDFNDNTNAVYATNEWAEALWETGRLTYDGQDYTTLGDWATVTSTGFGDGASFDFDASGGGTLALAGGGPVSSFDITLDMSDSTLSFPTDSNSTYSVEFTTVLTNGFSEVTNFPGDGFTNTVPVDTSTTNGFYRVKKSSSP